MNDKDDATQTPPSRPSSRGRTPIAIGAGALAGGILAFWGAGAIADATRSGATPDEASPLVETISPTPIGERFEIAEEGFLRPAQEIELVAEVAGKVIEVSPELRVGGRFQKGDMLLRIDPRTFKANLEQAKADLGAARASHAQAKADFERQQGLAEIGASAQARLDQSRAQLASARSRIEQAKASLEIASKQFEDATLRAPFDARVQAEAVSVGQYVAPGAPIATLFDASAAELVVSLSPTQAASVRRAIEQADGEVAARIGPTGASALRKTLTGDIVEIASALDPRSRTVDVLIRVDGAFAPENDGSVFAQDFVEARLPAMSATPLYLASDAIVRKQSYAWTVDDEGALEKIDILPVDQRGGDVVFAADIDLDGRRLVVTSLTEEVAGMKVRERNLAAGETETEGASGR